MLIGFYYMNTINHQMGFCVLICTCFSVILPICWRPSVPFVHANIDTKSALIVAINKLNWLTGMIRVNEKRTGCSLFTHSLTTQWWWWWFCLCYSYLLLVVNVWWWCWWPYVLVFAGQLSEHWMYCQIGRQLASSCSISYTDSKFVVSRYIMYSLTLLRMHSIFSLFIVRGV